MKKKFSLVSNKQHEGIKVTALTGRGRFAAGYT